jgi:hypothetical protein
MHPLHLFLNIASILLLIGIIHHEDMAPGRTLLLRLLIQQIKNPLPKAGLVFSEKVNVMDQANFSTCM